MGKFSKTLKNLPLKYGEAKRKSAVRRSLEVLEHALLASLQLYASKDPGFPAFVSPLKLFRSSHSSLSSRKIAEPRVPRPWIDGPCI